MAIVRLGKPGAFAAIALGAFLLVGCGQEPATDTEEEKAAGRETAEAMSREHADDTTERSPGAAIAPRRPVISDPKLPYAEVNDELVYGYLSVPADVFEPLPALIVIHEWWGLNDNVRAMADRLAAEGYMVLAVDMYTGQTAETPENARKLMLNIVENPEAARENLRMAYEFLEIAGAPRIGTVGWCFGGAWSLNAAQMFPNDLDAAVIYYGRVTDDQEKLAPITTPILGLFAAEDSGIKVDSVEAFRAALEKLEKNHEIHIYPDVGHAFANPTGRHYNAAAASDAWDKTVDFLGRYMLPPEDSSSPGPGSSTDDGGS